MYLDFICGYILCRYTADHPWTEFLQQTKAECLFHTYVLASTVVLQFYSPLMAATGTLDSSRARLTWIRIELSCAVPIYQKPEANYHLP